MARSHRDRCILLTDSPRNVSRGGRRRFLQLCDGPVRDGCGHGVELGRDQLRARSLDCHAAGDRGSGGAVDPDGKACGQTGSEAFGSWGTTGVGGGDRSTVRDPAARRHGLRPNTTSRTEDLRLRSDIGARCHRRQFDRCTRRRNCRDLRRYRTVAEPVHLGPSATRRRRQSGCRPRPGLAGGSGTPHRVHPRGCDCRRRRTSVRSQGRCSVHERSVMDADGIHRTRHRWYRPKLGSADRRNGVGRRPGIRPVLLRCECCANRDSVDCLVFFAFRPEGLLSRKVRV